jgi:hypothetical protein
VLKRLSTSPVDLFLVALVATVALAALLPAHGAAAKDVSAAAKGAIALRSFSTVPGCHRSRPGMACGNGDCTCWY